MPLPVHGPFHSRADLEPAAEVLQAELAAVTRGDLDDPAARRARATVRFRWLLDALEETGVGMGDLDMAVARSLLGLPVDTLVVLADWLARANAAGNAGLLAEAADYLRPCQPGPGARCEHGAWADCGVTDLAYRLRGLDPDQARRRVIETLRARDGRG